MIRRSPCERYIKFLLVHPHGFTVESIAGMLQQMGLDFPSRVYIEGLNDKIVLPVPFRPLDEHHTASQQFIMAQGVHGFFHPTPAMQLAHDLVRNPRAKEIIETMTLVEEPPAVISQVLRSRTSSPCTVEALKYYCAYYWDLNLVDAAEVRALLRLRHDRVIFKADGTEVDPEFYLIHGAEKKAFYKDPRRIVTEMSITPVAALLNRVRMGYMPTNADLAKMTDLARKVAILRANQSLLDVGPDSAAEARDFGVVAKLMTEIMNDVGSPEGALQNELAQIALQTTDVRPPTIHQLSDGKHTTDLQPTILDAEAVLEDGK